MIAVYGLNLLAVKDLHSFTQILGSFYFLIRNDLAG